MPKLEKVYDKNGVFKGHKYTIMTTNRGSYTLRDFSKSSFLDGTKPKWTFDIPTKIFNNTTRKKPYEIKFE